MREFCPRYHRKFSRGREHWDIFICEVAAGHIYAHSRANELDLPQPIHTNSGCIYRKCGRQHPTSHTARRKTRPESGHDRSGVGTSKDDDDDDDDDDTGITDTRGKCGRCNRRRCLFAFFCRRWKSRGPRRTSLKTGKSAALREPANCGVVFAPPEMRFIGTRGRVL